MQLKFCLRKYKNFHNRKIQIKEKENIEYQEKNTGNKTKKIPREKGMYE